MSHSARHARVAFLYAHPQVGPFALPDLETLRTRYDVRVVPCHSLRTMAMALARVPSCDLVLGWFGSTRYLPAVVLGKLLRRKIVIVAGGYDVASEPAIDYGNMRGGLSRLLGRLLFRLADVVLPVSHAAAREVERHAGVPPGRYQTIHHGIDTSHGSDVPLAAKERLVLSIGNLNESSIHRKGVLTLVRASALVPDVSVVIAGGATPGALDLLRAEAGPNVTFPGRVSDEERDALYRRARVYCQPSVHEAFGYAVAEAMLFNCLPVVTRQGSLPEVAGPWGRYIDRADDVAGLAEALRDALDGPVTQSGSPRQYIQDTFGLERRRVALLAVLDGLPG